MIEFGYASIEAASGGWMFSRRSAAEAPKGAEDGPKERIFTETDCLMWHVASPARYTRRERPRRRAVRGERRPSPRRLEARRGGIDKRAARLRDPPDPPERCYPRRPEESE